MHHATVRLRRAVIDRGIKGSQESRDVAIQTFLGELQELFTERLINRLNDDVLGGMFEDWLSSMGKLSHAERQEALVLDARLSPIPFTMYHKGFVDKDQLQDSIDTSTNVVSLHAR